ncbi:FAD-dependent oxidoreductase [Flaviflexus huanghaiensis]|uniref:FAD-dependent oxidoreductase n=1 Tax=Flaviflexus huanghaiensis TaxID=1111473 RepID=UPI0015F8F211|nr:FAD-dependent oxidoreductase [Flaviflexus huanghaiensis]
MNTWNHTYDVVVVGSGTGLFAALMAQKQGLSTLVVEKESRFGGSTALSGGGLWMPGNRVVREAGMKDTRERAERYLRTIVGDTSPESRWQTHLDYAAKSVDAILKNTDLRLEAMMEYADYFSDEPGGSSGGRSVEPSPFDLNTLGDDKDLIMSGNLSAPVPMPITGGDFRWMNLMARKPGKALPRIAKRIAQGIGGMALGKDYTASGKALAAGLYSAAKKAGVELWRSTPLVDLVLDDDRAVGVIVNHDGQEVRVKANRGVILAAGGFDRDLSKRREYQSEVIDDGWQFGAPGNTGDTIDLAHKHGLDLDLLDKAWWFPAIPEIKPGSGPIVLLAERSLPGSLIVDSTGHRFFNESINYMTAGEQMLGIDDGEPPHLPAWMVVDEKYVKSYVMGGVKMPGMAIPKEWFDAGIAVSADTIDELGKKIGTDDLPGGVARFNVLAAQGTDDDFGRGKTAYDRYYGDPTNTPNPNLRPLSEEGPYYAIKVIPGDLGTCGGLRADGKGRVYNTDGATVDGLYAIGNAAANAFGGVYPGAGATIGQGITFGYAAVDDILAAS